MTKHSVDWPAPAKLNLFLHIVGRRDDGYHLLQTVFQFLDYGDRLDFTLRDDGEIRRCYDMPGVAAEQDLIVRAARLLQEEAGIRQGVDIQLHKVLPMGGGLGGGSSDAATVLVALNQLWQAGIAEDHLAELGLELGADVPVFVRGNAAWAEGVGEELVAVTLPEPWFLVVIPPVSVSTAEIFRASELNRNAERITIRDFLEGVGANALEPVVVKHYPEVAEALEWLSAYAPARMTGSGACVFASFTEEDEAREALKMLPEKWKGFVARGCNRSPLRKRLEREQA